MRASPAFQIGLHHSVMWRCAVVALAVMAWACTLAWCASGTLSRGPATWLLANSAALLLVCGAMQSTRREALSLHWDTMTWRLGSITTAGEEPTAGQITVVMDFGFWMLLRFVQTDPALRHLGVRPQRCLAIQQFGLGPKWHALRCAVYSSRPAKLAPALDHPHHATHLE